MAYDLPHRFAFARSPDAAFAALDADVASEKASSLGHRGRMVEQTLAALRAFDVAGDPAVRAELVRRAAHEVWAFFVQRELCGLRDQKQIIKDYAIPGEVLVRLGARDTLQK